MANSSPGPIVADHEYAYRAILYPQWWNAAESRPSSAAFDDPVFSVDLASRSSPQATAARFKFVICLVQFNCGVARTIGFETRDEPDPLAPDNPAHAHVYSVDYESISHGQRKKKAKKLALICATILTPRID